MIKDIDKFLKQCATKANLEKSKGVVLCEYLDKLQKDPNADVYLMMKGKIKALYRMGYEPKERKKIRKAKDKFKNDFRVKNEIGTIAISKNLNLTFKRKKGWKYGLETVRPMTGTELLKCLNKVIDYLKIRQQSNSEVEEQGPQAPKQ